MTTESKTKQKLRVVEALLRTSATQLDAADAALEKQLSAVDTMINKKLDNIRKRQEKGIAIISSLLNEEGATKK